MRSVWCSSWTQRSPPPPLASSTACVGLVNTKQVTPSRSGLKLHHQQHHHLVHHQRSWHPQTEPQGRSTHTSRMHASRRQLFGPGGSGSSSSDESQGGRQGGVAPDTSACLAPPTTHNAHNTHSSNSTLDHHHYHHHHHCAHTSNGLPMEVLPAPTTRPNHPLPPHLAAHRVPSTAPHWQGIRRLLQGGRGGGGRRGRW